MTTDNKHGTIYHFAGFCLATQSRQLTDPQGQDCQLSSRAFDTLQVLLEYHGATIAKNTLIEKVWPDSVIEENNLNQAISGLRKVLGDSRTSPTFIQTIPGRGYRFVADVTVTSSAEIANKGAVTVEVAVPAPDHRQHSSRRFLLPLAAGLLLVLSLMGLLVGQALSPSEEQAETPPSPLHAGLFGGQTVELDTLPPDSFEAYRYLTAAKNAYFNQSFEQTWRLSRQAIDLDEDYVEAHYYFSYVNTVLMGTPLEGMGRDQHFELAMHSARRIIDLAPDSTQGYALRAGALGTRGEWEAARRDVERLRAMGMPPSEMKFYAPVLLSLGDFHGARRILESNQVTEPVNLYGRGFLLAAYELTGQRDKARQEYALGEKLNPNWWGDTVNLFLDLGRDRPLRDIGDLPIHDELKELLRRIDERDYVLNELERFRNNQRDMSAESIYYSAIAARMDRPALAVEFMRDALDGIWMSFFWLWLPVFDEVRQLPAFHALLKESGIPAYWDRHGWPELCRRDGADLACDWQAY